jgi:thioredoxin 2
MSPSPEQATVAPSVIACASCGRRNRVPSAATGTPRCAACHAPLAWLVEADDTSFAAVTAGTLPVLVDLWAPWCGPCRAVGPIIEHLAHTLAGRLKVVKVNVDHAPEIARQFRIQGVPTMLVLHGGDEVARQVGALPAAPLTRWVEDHLDPTAA